MIDYSIDIIDEIMNRLVELRHQLSPNSSLSPLSQTLKRLFSHGSGRANDMLLIPYQDVIESAQVGFSNDAEVRLVSSYKYDSHLSSPEFEGVLLFSVDDIKQSPFLTWEFELQDQEWKGKSGASVSIAGFGTWGLRGDFVLRQYRENGEFEDIRFGRFELGETRTVFHQHFTFRRNIDECDFVASKLLVMFEPRNFRSELHYFKVDLT